MAFKSSSLGLILLLFSVAVSAQNKTILSLQHEQFLSPQYDPYNSDSYQYLGAQFQSENPTGEGFGAVVVGGYAIGEPLLSYTNFRELYYQGKLDEQQSFVLGRFRLPWSALDERWEFGLFQPTFRWNPLDPEAQGLTGLFWEKQGGNQVLDLFASFIYLPNQGPSYELNDNGEFTRASPWFRRPPTSAMIFSEVTKLEYQIQVPPTSEIVFQPSIGGRYLWTPGIWSIQASYFYKPMNQLSLGYQGKLDLSKDRGVVDIQPAVIFHQIGSLDASVQTKSYHAGISMVLDRPDNKTNPDVQDFTWTKYQAAFFLSPYVDLFFGKNLKLSGQVLKVSGGEMMEFGPQARGQGESINTLYPHRDAAQLSAQILRSWRGDLVRFGTSYLMGSDNLFSVWKTEGSWETSSGWIVNAVLQMIRARQDADSQVEILDYTQNDRFVMGVGHVF